MRFGKLDINPALNPAILDTGTWDPQSAWLAIDAVPQEQWAAGDAATHQIYALPTSGVQLWTVSCAWLGETWICPAGLPDGQVVFIAVGPQAATIGLDTPLATKELPAPAGSLAVYAAEAAVVDRFVRYLAPEQGPRALGPVPRLGIGTRMTTAVWPPIWKAMAAGHFAANAIQNSVRELNFLESLLAGRPPEQNIAFGFGAIETGYTGSSFEGLWVAGVLNALSHGVRLPYGADADHIQVKRGENGLARARRLLDATRYYSFFTLDVSDVLDYTTGAAGSAAGTAPLGTTLTPAVRQDVFSYHKQGRRIGGFDYRPGDTTLERLAGKYWVALDAVGAMYEHLLHLKAGVPFDLELSIDEHPNEVPTFECLTSESELIFVLLEMERRGIPLTHIAPNFGVEKGTDYRGADGLPGFEDRARRLCRIAGDMGIMPDFHSGDDLSAAARRAIGRATGGRNHFKVSPNLQLLFAEVLAQHHPELFHRWWDDALAYAQREAAAGSDFARSCIQQSDSRQPSAHDPIFHNFSFAFVGRRDAAGQFRNREAFYKLSPSFYQAYETCIVQYLVELAEDCLAPKP